MKKASLFLLLHISFATFAQISFKGIVLDSITNKPLKYVQVENITKHYSTITDDKGYFEINVFENDHILYSIFSYQNKIVQVKKNTIEDLQTIYLKPKPIQLKEIVIKKEFTKYQQDSARRANIYQDAFLLKQENSISSPITLVYQKLSKKHKNLRKFQGQIIDIEKQKFIDSRYSSELVAMLTKLKEPELQQFINAYPMEYEYARTASELEIKMWIKYNFSEYKKNKTE